MMWYFSSMHNRHMPDEGLKVLALVRIFQLVVQVLEWWGVLEMPDV